jgi:hypothetical protein
MQQGAGGVDAYLTWQTQWAVADNSALAWKEWKDAQSNPGDPLYGTAEPTKIPYPPVPVQRVQIYSTTMNFHMIVSWSSIEESTHVGLGKPDAKMGDLWWTRGETVEYTEFLYGGKNGAGEGFRTLKREYVILNWQDSLTTYRSIALHGLAHNNIVYKGKGVETTAIEALDDPDESGFLVPLHDGIMKLLSLKDSTQMATACTYVVFNCYQVVKQKWYQTTWFKVVLIIAVVVFTVVTAGAGSPSVGLLGPAAAVGASLGAAATVAVLVGTIANAIAAMLLTKIIMMGATALFGEKVGAIVGAVASIVAIAYGSGQISASSGMAANFSSLATAENILKLTMSAGKGYAEYIQSGIQETLTKTDELLANYEDESRRIAQAYKDNLGDNGLINIDPMALTNALGFIPEASKDFLARTLLTGSDIADMTSSMISNFAAMTTTVELS